MLAYGQQRAPWLAEGTQALALQAFQRGTLQELDILTESNVSNSLVQEFYTLDLL